MQENHKDEFALGGSSMAVTADRVYYGHKGKEDSYSDNYF